jgi:hypothetical protein
MNGFLLFAAAVKAAMNFFSQMDTEAKQRETPRGFGVRQPLPLFTANKAPEDWRTPRRWRGWPCPKQFFYPCLSVVKFLE